jgi:PAS domain S-box-containing protein
MSPHHAPYSFLQYVFQYPAKQRQLEPWHFRAIISYQFMLICMGTFVTTGLLDLVMGEYWLAALCGFNLVLFVGLLYLHYRGYYLATATVYVLVANAIIFLHDARYGFEAGVYLFYFPVFFAIFVTLSFKNKLWFYLYLGLTLNVWVLMELTGHRLLLADHTPAERHMVFLYSLVLSLSVTILFVYLILNQIRNGTIVHEREKLKSVLDSNGQMMMLINRKWEVELFNKRFFDYYQAVYGHTLEVGKPYLDYTNPQNRALLENSLTQAFAGNTVQEDVQVMVGSKTAWMSLNFVPIRNGNGVVRRVAFSALDISERKNYEKNLSETNEILTKLNHELDHFIYRSSHDMRAPLASVMGLVELFQSEEDEAEREEYISMIGKSVHKLDELLIDITQYAKNKKLGMRRQKVDFDGMIHDLVNALKYAKNAQTVEFRIRVSQNAPFYGDEERIRSVIGNLLSNAVRYRSSGREAFVSIVAEVTDMARLTISDNGIGIEPEYINRIFDMFFKVSTRSSGSGLGLYIVKETLLTMGGHIEVDSLPGVGTTFTVTIPEAKGEL